MSKIPQIGMTAETYEGYKKFIETNEMIIKKIRDGGLFQFEEDNYLKTKVAMAGIIVMQPEVWEHLQDLHANNRKQFLKVWQDVCVQMHDGMASVEIDIELAKESNRRYERFAQPIDLVGVTASAPNVVSIFDAKKKGNGHEG